MWTGEVGNNKVGDVAESLLRALEVIPEFNPKTLPVWKRQNRQDVIMFLCTGQSSALVSQGFLKYLLHGSNNQSINPLLFVRS